MRFLLRGLIGLALTLLTVAFIGAGAWKLYEARQATDEGRDRGPRERAFAVPVEVLTPVSMTPETRAYGEIEAWRKLELRAAAGGEIVDVAPNFRDGAAVKEGDLLFLVDPAEAKAEFADSEAAVAEAEAEKAESVEALEVAKLERASAERQRDLRAQALARQQDLKERGFGTDAAIEQAELEFSSAEQSLSSRRAALVAASKRVERAALSIRRAEIARDEAARDLADTRQTAPFSGLLSDVEIFLGERVTGTEALGVLIDPAALEVKFQVSNSEFSRLIDRNGSLTAAPVTVTLKLGEREVATVGRVARVSAVSDRDSGGRFLYARLETGADTLLRPGDFVTVSITEPELTEVAVVPAGAVSRDGRILVLDDQNRIQEIQTSIVRRVGDKVALRGVPFGAKYVTERAPQLGPGVQVRPIQANGASAEKRGDGSDVAERPRGQGRSPAQRKRDAPG